MKATAEYAAAKIAWDMKDCPIPEGYDSCRIRKILEGAFEEQGYSGPVSITAYADQTETPGYILQGLFSTGVSVAHTRSAKIQVLWDMFDYPIPEGYDARQVRPSIEAAFKELGYSGPVSITAYGYLKHTPLQALSSTGVDVVHTVPG
uniref:NYN domain-containing protein n=1 Tax=Brassica campestris TaxID=3711 RepID=M4FBY9_BRACM